MNEALIDACREGDLVAAADAIRAGADIHCYGDSPMLQAAIHGHYLLVQHLWLHAPLPRMFHVGQGTLRKAAQRGHTSIVVFLAPFGTASEIEAARHAAVRAGQEGTALALERFQTQQNDNPV